MEGGGSRGWGEFFWEGGDIQRGIRMGDRILILTRLTGIRRRRKRFL